jgi:4-nitrophenyl phosphatase
MQATALLDLPADLAARIHRAKGFVIDMDGTIALGDSVSGSHRALPGAIDFLALLRRRGIPFRIFTNGTAKPPNAYADSLRRAGFDIYNEEMMTPSTSAAHWFRKRGIKKVRALGLGGVQQPLIEAGIEVVQPAQRASGVEAVFTGWFREFTFPDLEAACKDIWDGAALTTASNVAFFATAGGKSIGASFAINAMIRSLTGRRAVVLGKPAATAFHLAVASMGLPRSAASEVVVLGDDPALEMRMAHSAGALSVGMTTGMLNRNAVHGLPIRQRPDLLLDDLSALMRIVES